MVIQSKKVWLADQFVPAAIEVNDGRITAILPYGTKDVDDDYGDKRIVPGFMDIHCHGAYEFDTNDANEDGLRYWAEHIVSEGVTSFLATTITQSVEVDLPDATESQAVSSNDNPPVIVEVSGIGQYTVVVEKDRLERLPPEQVVAEVSSRFKANPKTVFLIGGAKDVPYDEIIKALNLLHSAGVKSVGLMTQPI
mgnify:CR=1 FL=1